MRTYPEDEFDRKELEELNAEGWMVETLKLNPDYVHWGPHEDYMSGGKGWEENYFSKTWDEFSSTFSLDDLNECVNFYFFIRRESEGCSLCGETGLNPATRQISEDFYNFENKGRRWCDDITEDEVEALVRAGRLWDLTDRVHFNEENNRWMKWADGQKTVCEKPKIPTPEEVNNWNKTSLGHDAINRHILIEARAKRLGVWGFCEKCEGKGYIYTEDKGKLGIVLWMLHPRKGASRGVEIKELTKEDMSGVYSFLNKAAERNANRFSKILKGEDNV